MSHNKERSHEALVARCDALEQEVQQLKGQLAERGSEIQEVTDLLSRLGTPHTGTMPCVVLYGDGSGHLEVSDCVPTWLSPGDLLPTLRKYVEEHGPPTLEEAIEALESIGRVGISEEENWDIVHRYLDSQKKDASGSVVT
jgi:hypothetical protein